jgi:hypothetical protein
MNTNDVNKLVNAYHAVYDVKDKNYNNDILRMKAYHAIRAISDLITALGEEPPDRYDAPPSQEPIR